MALLNFSARGIDPAGPSQMLPVSDNKGHLVAIVDSEMKPTKNDPNAFFLDLTLETDQGAQGHYRLNVGSTNSEAQRIAYHQLSAICHAVGVYDISDTTQLHGLPFRAVVALQKKQKADDPDYTEVKYVLCADGSKPKPIGGAAPAASTGAPPAGFGSSAPAAAPAPQAAWNQPKAPAPAPAPSAAPAPAAAPAWAGTPGAAPSGKPAWAK